MKRGNRGQVHKLLWFGGRSGRRCSVGFWQEALWQLHGPLGDFSSDTSILEFMVHCTRVESANFGAFIDIT